MKYTYYINRNFDNAQIIYIVLEYIKTLHVALFHRNSYHLPSDMFKTISLLSSENLSLSRTCKDKKRVWWKRERERERCGKLKGIWRKNVRKIQITEWSTNHGQWSSMHDSIVYLVVSSLKQNKRYRFEYHPFNLKPLKLNWSSGTCADLYQL